MTSPSLNLIDDCHLYISGDVVIHPNAVIAPGVLLQADPGCRLTIAAGVCVGQGSVLHAHGGSLEIEAGAILGNGVLIVGKAKIGSNACIGSLTTLIDQSVDPNQAIPPHSLLGDTSRQVALAEPSPSAAPAPTPAAPSPTPAPAAPAPPKKAPTQVYGQAYVERFMITMFPHRQSLHESSEATHESSGNDTNGSSPQPPP
jgi:carbon dioxide concentrating mechanism protein CcmN